MHAPGRHVGLLDAARAGQLLGPVTGRREYAFQHNPHQPTLLGAAPRSGYFPNESLQQNLGASTMQPHRDDIASFLSAYQFGHGPGVMWNKPNPLSELIRNTDQYRLPDWALGQVDNTGLRRYDHLSRVHNAETFGNQPMDTKDIDNLISSIGHPAKRAATPPAMKDDLYTHQKIALEWMMNAEKGNNKGGILADDMGLGKTISTLALIVSNPSKDPHRKTNLIVGPVAIISQWVQEVKTKIRPNQPLSVIVHHSKKHSYEDMREHDIVLTTYGIIAAEFRSLKVLLSTNRLEMEDIKKNDKLRKTFPLLHPKNQWFRVVLDEAQNVKNINTKASQGACLLESLYRWCLTGTPMMNGVEELYALIKYLRIPPFNNQSVFNRTFQSLLRGKEGGVMGNDAALEKLRVTLAAIMLRRTKTSEIDGKPIVQLPQKAEENVPVVLSEEELSYYRALEKRTAAIFNKYNRDGTVMKHYAVMLVLILRLRQACCHPHLNTDVEEAPSGRLVQQTKVARELPVEVVQQIKAHFHGGISGFQCHKCGQADEHPLFFACGHSVCQDCLPALQQDVGMDDNAENSDGIRCPNTQCGKHVSFKTMFSLLAFKTAHMPALIPQAAQCRQPDGFTMHDSDSDEEGSDGKSELYDDVDEQGNLKGFIASSDDESDSRSPTSENSVAVTGTTTPAADAELDDELKALPKLTALKTMSMSAAGRSGNPMSKPRKDVCKDSKIVIDVKKIRATELGELRREAQKNSLARKKYFKYLQENWQPSAKVTKAVELMTKICNGKKEKVIVFSFFTGLLDLIEVPLEHEAGVPYRRFDGSMSGAQRDASLDAFREQDDVRILLVSLKSGNAGLNLTMANNVIIMDPYWNPFTEMQAVDRTHRLGQTRPVQVYRIIVAGTVEDRIMELQDRKRNLVEAALDEGKAASLASLGARDLGYLMGIHS